MEIVEFQIGRYDEVCRLWQQSAGVGFEPAVDTKERVALSLLRNPGLSFVALDKGEVVGAVMGCHDGWRGHVHHLAVAEGYRNKGVGKTLVEKVTARLQQLGIRKCNAFVFCDNADGQQFWKKIGWTQRAELQAISKTLIL